MAWAGAAFATCMYRMVVSMETCPASAWMVLGACPAIASLVHTPASYALAAVRAFLVAEAFSAAALRLRVAHAFLPAARRLRVAAAFFAASDLFVAIPDLHG